MSEERPSEVLGALPRTRPHRRSGKRAGRPAETPEAVLEATPDVKARGQVRAVRGRAGTKSEPESRPRSSAGQRQPDKPRADKPLAERPREKPRAVTAARDRGAYKGERLRQPPQPAGTPSMPRPRKPVPASGAEILGTAVQAAAELAEIGLSVGARALRNAAARLPRP